VSRQTPYQPGLPFEPSLDQTGVPGENPADELSLDRFAVLLLQEVVTRSAALDTRPRRKPRAA
jgi:hypothetical protein